MKPETGTERGKEAMCSIRGCGRPARSHGMCQTHRKQVLKTGKVGLIRPLRPPRSGTVMLNGRSLTAPCAKVLKRHAREHGTTVGGTMVDILEAWARRKKPRR
jgi:hypothetical protein